MFTLFIYDDTGEFVEFFVKLINVIAQADNTLAFSYLDAMGDICTDKYRLVKGSKFVIKLSE